VRANIDKKECKISSGLELQQSTVDIRLRPRLGAAPGGSLYAFVVVLTPAAPCWVTLNIRLFASHIRGLKLICKYYVVHKTGSAQRIATLPEIDWSTAIGDVHKNLMKIGHVVPEIWWRTDKHRQTDNETNRLTCSSQYSVIPTSGGIVKLVLLTQLDRDGIYLSVCYSNFSVNYSANILRTCYDIGMQKHYYETSY